MAVVKKNYEDIVFLENGIVDGRLTQPFDGKIFDYRKMMDEVKMLGRPLTVKEAERYRIK